MKTIPPACPEPETGRQYWRSLDQLADTPEFRQWLEREFPDGASEWTDAVSRRHFVKIMSASFVLAGFGLAGSGCRRPEEKILPFSKLPEGYVHGVAQYYATAMPTRTGAIPLVARSHDGRPIKVEGNSSHPDSGTGGTDRYAQASILNLYDPDRATRFTRQGQSCAPEAACDYLASLSRSAEAAKGQGLSFLVESNTSPSRRRLQDLIRQKFPQAQWYVHEPVDFDIHRRSATQAFGKSVQPSFRFDAARVIVSLDCDFLGSEEDVQLHIGRFAQGRRMGKPQDSLNRLYAVESLYSLTGMNADHRLRLPASQVVQAAAALAAEIFKESTVPPDYRAVAKPPAVDPKWFAECARDLREHGGQSLVVAGHRQPLAVHMIAHAINEKLGNIGKTVLLHEVPAPVESSLADLARALHAGQVETLVILGGNPAYTAPADLDWTAAVKKAKTVVRLGYYEDETFPACTWHLPAAHYLESWGDVRTSAGTLAPIQPLIAPLFNGLTELEVLARIGGYKTFSPYEIVRETFAQTLGSGDIEAAWKKFLHDGFLPQSGYKTATAQVNPVLVGQAMSGIKPASVNKASLEVVFHRDYSLDDGRYNNNGWLQELPDPITKITWDNAVLISRKTAHELGVKNNDLVEITLDKRKVRGPIWVQPGIADYSLGLGLGYGREKTGRVGHKTGFNAYRLRTTTSENIAVGATLTIVGETYAISCTQDHWSMEGRAIIREANLDQYREHPDFAKRMVLEEPPGAGPMYPNPLDKLKEQGLHQWGMAIDLNMCVGCSACVIACQSENNIPIVGKEQIKRGREMHWLRIDRYYAGKPQERDRFDTFRNDEDQQFQAWIDDPQAVTQPMLCQHCEAAPCENVCPVNATVHDQEGLNLMVYNRCVGTRYCSNNCPYKARRFNYFDYNKRPINALYKGPLGHRQDDEWDLIKMIKNPEVTVRMRGVMEKCTFCVQRIESAKIAQKVKARDSGDVVVPEGTFTTACAQACPAGAIVFGNLNDGQSRVSQLKQLDRNYPVLEFLLTKPRLTYLARVRNPNRQMPDYYDAPLTFQAYEQKMGDPFKNKVEGHEAAPAGALEKGAH